MKIPSELKPSLEANRLLFISALKKNILRSSKKSSMEGNKLIVNFSDEVIVGFAERGRNIELLTEDRGNGKIKPPE